MHQFYKLQPLYVPSALLQRDIGGLTTAQDVRKVNFLKQGVMFVRSFVEAINPSLLTHAPKADPGHKRQSGAIVFDSDSLHLRLTEEASREGLVLSVEVTGPDGNAKLNQRIPLSNLNKPGGWDHFTTGIRDALKTQQSLFH